MKPEHGADVNVAGTVDGQCAFSFARKHSRWNIVELLLESGRVDAVALEPDEHGRSFLHHACHHGQVEVIKNLFEYYYNHDNIDLATRTKDGLTPLEVAASNEKTDTVFYLLRQQNSLAYTRPDFAWYIFPTPTFVFTSFSIFTKLHLREKRKYYTCNPLTPTQNLTT